MCATIIRRITNLCNPIQRPKNQDHRFNFKFFSLSRKDTNVACSCDMRLAALVNHVNGIIGIGMCSSVWFQPHEDMI